jgi:hypothetical protein
VPNLPKYTLVYDENKDRWPLVNDRSNRTVRSYASKAAATKGGALRKALGAEGGSVKIQKANGRFQEERTYPRSKDPRRSKG